ncbi:hypothetical protein PGB34_05045 [Xenophilus arseniciresistens]|uniref:Uncharacterized protein n=1 Tax=Xenophilus arseniciresistens TaxID=1283306 RepID=A0AAE3N6Z8_9BURK|nr:hypothetical protein [Xenophilus arseniciresistens]MDA7415723.1 hypothetical protein [Xenophilus arseniciresistens]
MKPAAALAAPLILVLGGPLARRQWLIAQLQGRLQALPQPLPTPSFCDGEAASALARLSRAALVLLCAARADEDASAQARQAFLREQLHAAGAAYGVLHGDDAAIALQAWQALQSALGLAQQQTGDAQPTAEARSLANWRSNCEKCSDPVCEHRLFSDLVGQRAQA